MLSVTSKVITHCNFLVVCCHDTGKFVEAFLGNCSWSLLTVDKRRHLLHSTPESRASSMPILRIYFAQLSNYRHYRVHFVLISLKRVRYICGYGIDGIALSHWDSFDSLGVHEIWRVLLEKYCVNRSIWDNWQRKQKTYRDFLIDPGHWPDFSPIVLYGFTHNRYNWTHLTGAQSLHNFLLSKFIIILTVTYVTQLFEKLLVTRLEFWLSPRW